MTDKLIYLLLAKNLGTTSDIETQTLPFTFKSNGRRLKNYQIYGNTGGVGDLSNTNKYIIPVTINGTATNISLDSPLDDGDYIDFREQKRFNSDNTNEILSLPAITSINGISVLSVNTAVQPEKVYVQGNVEQIVTASLQTLNTNLQNLQTDWQIENENSLDVMPEKPVLNLNEVGGVSGGSSDV